MSTPRWVEHLIGFTMLIGYSAYRWAPRPYIAWGRRQLRIGWVRKRTDRWCDEYHYIAVEWQL